MIRSRNYIAVPPGATIKEQLDDRGMSQKEFAARMGMSEKHISHLINGSVQLTPETAYRLETVLGLPARFWNRLEALYREEIVKAETENAMDADKELVKKFPYNDMAKFGWLRQTQKAEERVIALRHFFEVVSLDKLENEALLPQIACRRLAVTEKTDFALLAWAQKAKIEARGKNVSPINLKELKAHLPQIRAMTSQDPKIFCVKLQTLLAECGIALIFLPHISGSFLNGATFYDNHKIVMGLTVRGKSADIFWFSLFHELGHILLGHLHQKEGVLTSHEEDADAFAAELLIPSKDFLKFTNRKLFSKTAIRQFSKDIGIDAGIVVGRLQKDGFIEFGWCNDLKTKYEYQTN